MQILTTPLLVLRYIVLCLLCTKIINNKKPIRNNLLIFKNRYCVFN